MAVKSRLPPEGSQTKGTHGRLRTTQWARHWHRDERNGSPRHGPPVTRVAYAKKMLIAQLRAESEGLGQETTWFELLTAVRDGRVATSSGFIKHFGSFSGALASPHGHGPPGSVLLAKNHSKQGYSSLFRKSVNYG